MRIAKVVGTAVSTAKLDALVGKKLLLVASLTEDGATGDVITAVDAVGAGRGEVVLVVTGGAAARTPSTEGAPVDATIVAIVDRIESDGWFDYTKE
ncbi:MAG: EutN/CcmL family microcompartment protein [Acidimicrobiales bacterium]|nr:EutN/CcmL family microcompartment protein [Acidimicrobiales bacterium]